MNADREKCRILVATPDAAELRRLNAFLERMGANVLQAMSAQSLVQMVGAVPVDVILSDDAFRGAFRQASRIQPDARHVVLADDLCADWNVDRILKKPVDLFVLERLVSSVLEADEHQTEESTRDTVRA